MLQELRIKNLALVRELYIAFPERQDGLIVLTGETGAGKSMILQAIHLLTGGRGSTSWIRAGAEQAEVEAFFLLGEDQQETLEMLHEHELASGNECLIRRVISRKSRSRLFINDRSVTARFAADLTENLVNIASQHDHQKLLQSKNHLDFLDTYGELWPQRHEFITLFRHWQQLSSRLRDLQEREQDKEQRRDFLEYQIREIKDIDPVAGEDEKLVRERDLLKASTTLAGLARESVHLLQGQMADSLAVIRKNMERARELDPGITELSERIISSCYEVEDLAAALRQYRDSLPMDQGRLEEISRRLGELKGLQRKYGPELEDVLRHLAHAERELVELEDLADDIEVLELSLEETSTRALLMATELSEARRSVAARLKKAMEEELATLQFPGAVFEIAQGCPEGMGMKGILASGRDQVEFLFSANPGEPPKPLAEVVSGGELSRLMLAMKCILAKRDQVGTVIFDEVDAGIGGQAAEAVAAKISELSRHHQVFCITHLPQIAAWATTHFLVEKEVAGESTTTNIRLLDDEQRVEELARMLGGENPSRQTLALARELAREKGGMRR